MLSNVVIYYWSCDFLSSRNLTGLPSFLGFLSLPVCTHRLRQRRRWRSYALGHGGAVSLDDLWSKNGARHSQWRRWTQKNQLRDNALALTGFWMISLCIFIYFWHHLCHASEQIRRFAPTCWKENKRFRIPSSSWRRLPCSAHHCRFSSRAIAWDKEIFTTHPEMQAPHGTPGFPLPWRAELQWNPCLCWQ